MDDIVLVAIGRQYIDQCVKLEQMTRMVGELKAEVAKLKATKATDAPGA